MSLPPGRKERTRLRYHFLGGREEGARGGGGGARGGGGGRRGTGRGEI